MLMVQVLSPTKKGPGGAPSLNRLLQPIMNPPRPGAAEMPVFFRKSGEGGVEEDGAGLVWRVGDRMVQMVNNYSTEAWNGEWGG